MDRWPQCDSMASLLTGVVELRACPSRQLGPCPSSRTLQPGWLTAAEDWAQGEREGWTPVAVQERIRALHRELLLQSCGVFESQRVCEFLVLGLASKNNRTRIEAIEVPCPLATLRCPAASSRSPPARPVRPRLPFLSREPSPMRGAARPKPPPAHVPVS